MLQLKDIRKTYDVGDNHVKALDGVSIDFRECEFVSVLGPSGCGKTTLLNIVGGLDRYSDGDLLINGKSTKKFKDRDWDTYRNHSVGFVFQSYNLIPHQTVLANVELALTLSGVSKAERRRRAIDALNKVGLGDQLKKKPNQMSGGQMQRVAIARAIVNDPDILLADEPTGALDTVTSVQIMEILKEIAKDKLVIMVTHNPELAEEYSTRIVKLRDGRVIDDSMPFEATAEEDVVRQTAIKKNNKRTSMSFFTAFGLSLNNLMTKKGRTFMTSFAGSIGIIGIALILAISNGVDSYISLVQENTLSSYPLSVQQFAQDLSLLKSAFQQADSSSGGDRDAQEVYIDNSLGTMMNALSATKENNLEAFKVYLEEHKDELDEYVNDIQYTYSHDLQIYNVVYKENTDHSYVLDDNGDREYQDMRKVGIDIIFDNMGSAFSGMSELMQMGGTTSLSVFSEMIDNQELLDQQYDVIVGQWPQEYNEVVLVVSSNNQISLMSLYMLGMRDPSNIQKEMEALGSDDYVPDEVDPYSFDRILDSHFKLVLTSDFYAVDESKDKYAVKDKDGNIMESGLPVWKDTRLEMTEDELEQYILDNGIDLKISGIIRPKEGATATSISGVVGYSKELTNYILEHNENSEILQQQKKSEDHEKFNVLTGLPFERTVFTPETIHLLIDKIDDSTLDQMIAYGQGMFMENADELTAKDKMSFLTRYALLSEENRVEIFSLLLNNAQKSPLNATKVDTLCSIVSGTTNGIQVTKENFIQLLPVLDITSVGAAVNGIAGLPLIAGDEYMNDVYKDLDAKYPMEGTSAKDSFLQVLMMMPAEESGILLADLVNAAVQADKTQVDALCMILSASAGAEITSDNLAQALPNMQPMSLYLLLDGIPGLIDLSDEADLQAMYDQMNAYPISLDRETLKLILSNMPYDDDFIKMEEMLYSRVPGVDDTLESVLDTLDDAEEAKPASINFYAVDFKSKEKIESFIDRYNEVVKNDGREEDMIEPTDMVGDLLSSVTDIINAISYVLIAFVSISLIVSSIMIGIITYISVLERTKEIGILRAMGASKRDITRVFNAETLIIGLCSGVIGIVFTVLACFPISWLIQYLTDIPTIAVSLPFLGGLILVVISTVLTMISGLIPSFSAAKKDPVVALRTE